MEHPKGVANGLKSLGDFASPGCSRRALPRRKLPHLRVRQRHGPAVRIKALGAALVINLSENSQFSDRKVMVTGLNRARLHYAEVVMTAWGNA